MSILLGALYHGRDLEEVRQAWRRRMMQLGEPRLLLDVSPSGAGLVRVLVRTRRGRQVPHRRLGTLVRGAIGPEREELAEFWLLEPAEGSPGALRLEGAGWQECLDSVALRETRQVRLWSPLVCPGRIRRQVEELGWKLGLEMRNADGWAVLAVPRRKPEPKYPPPWRGNYGW